MKRDKQLMLQTGQLDPEDRERYMEFRHALHDARRECRPSYSCNRESSEGPGKGEVKKKKKKKKKARKT